MPRWFKHFNDFAYSAYRQARRVVVFVIGTTVVLFGVSLIFLPGPAVVVIPIGLGILAIEFAWARRWLRRLRDTATAAVQAATGGGSEQPGAASSTAPSAKAPTSSSTATEDDTP